jgi:hypothetical protein
MNKKFLFLGGCLLALTASATVSVNDFGAIPNDGKDDTAAVKKAFAFLKKNKKSTLVFGEGQYDFSQPHPQHHSYLFPIRGENNVTITGSNGKTLLMFHDFSYLIWAHDCKNLTIRNLTMDYSRPHFSLATVTSVAPDELSFEVDVDKDYPINSTMPIRGLLELNPVNNLPERGLSAHYVVSKVEDLAPQKLKIRVKQVLRPQLKKNTRLLLRHHLYTGNIMRFHHCKNVVTENLTVYSAPGMGIVTQYTTNFTARNVKFTPNPERKNAPFSIASDGVTSHSCKGKFLVDGLVVDGNLDDGMNYHQSFYWTIRKQVSKRAAHLGIARTRSAEIPQFRPGDKVDFLNEKLQVYATRTVASCGKDNKEHAPLVEFTEDLPSFRPGIDLIVFNNEGMEIIIRNSFFRSHRGRGITLQTSNVIIENNRFESSLSGVHLTTCISPFAEGGPVINAIVRNNVFNNCMIRTQNRSAVIEINATLRDPFFPGAEGRLSLNGPNRDIKIIGNKINRTNNAAIAIASVNGCEVRDNEITDACLNPGQTWGTKLFWTKNAVTFAGASNVVFSNNTYRSSTGKPGRLVVGESCENLVFKDNKGFNTLREKVIPQK